MARIERQLTIWSELERELPPGLEEVRDFVDTLSEFDEKLVRELELERARETEPGKPMVRGRGRDDLPVRAMWNLLATSLYLRNGKQSETLAELRRNSDLARLLGFRELAPNIYRLPSSSALSRFHVKLKDRANVRELFNGTVAALAEENPDFGKHTAIDASDVRTHARAKKVRTEDTEATPKTEESAAVEQAGREVVSQQGGEAASVEEAEGGKEKTTSSDPDASWSVKTKTWEGTNGEERKTTKSTFGFKMYLDTDTTIPGIVSVEVETGSYSDSKKALPMIDSGLERLPAGRRETVAMDKGFDSEDNVRGAWERDIVAIVPVREVPKKLDQLPKEDREEAIEPGSNIVRDKYTGEVACYDAKPSASASENENENVPTRRTMTYAGAEIDRSSHKFRCPLGATAKDECPFFDSCKAGPAGSQGRQVRISFKTDIRRFAPIYPRSKRWKRLYNGRSAVERINSYAKEVLPLERHALRGKAAIELRVLLVAMTINVRTINSLRHAKVLANAA